MKVQKCNVVEEIISSILTRKIYGLVCCYFIVKAGLVHEINLTVPELNLFKFAMGILGGKYGFMCKYNRKSNTDIVWSVVYDLKCKKVWENLW